MKTRGWRIIVLSILGTGALYGGTGTWENFTSMKDVKGVVRSGHAYWAATSGGLFLIILALVSFASTAVGLTAAYLWVAPGLLLQGRTPSQAASDTGVGPPDIAAWIVCFLFWAVVGGCVWLWLRRVLTARRSPTAKTI